MAEYVDRAYLDVDGEIIDANSIEDDVDGNKEPIAPMNRKNRATSHQHGVPSYSITAEFNMDLELQTRFVRMLENNTRFTVKIEYAGSDGGDYTVSYLDCEVYKVTRSASEGSTTTISLEIGALDRQTS